MAELYIKAIMIYYGYTLEKAKQIYSVMDESDRREIFYHVKESKNNG